MDILVGCEISGYVSEALAAKGHNVTSCDLKPGHRIYRRTHYVEDVFKVATFKKYDMGIFFPDCT